jgi:aryl-phospho-beta-D-glucosidase BglC (GH1 family)
MDVAQGGNAKAILEEHWDDWIKDEDWNWIKEHGYNSVRIPVSLRHSYMGSESDDRLDSTIYAGLYRMY